MQTFPNFEASVKATIAKYQAIAPALSAVLQLLPTDKPTYTKRLESKLNELGYSASFQKDRNSVLSPRLYIWGNGISYEDRECVFLSTDYGDIYMAKTPEECAIRNRAQLSDRIEYVIERASFYSTLDIEVEYLKIKDITEQVDKYNKMYSSTDYIIRHAFDSSL